MASGNSADSNMAKEKDSIVSKKYKRCQRWIRAITFIAIALTLLSISYGFYVTIDCRDTFYDYKCAITSGKTACTGVAEILVASGVSLFCMFGALGGHAHLRNALFIASMIQAIFGVIILVLSLKSNFITEGTDEQMREEMSHCRYNTTATTEDQECWQQYQEDFCSDWGEAEAIICQAVVTTQMPLNLTTMLPNATQAPTEVDQVQAIIEGCIANFEEWAEAEFYYYVELAYPEMFLMSVLYLALGLLLLMVGRSYEKLKTQLKEEKERTTLMAPDTSELQNSRSVHHPGTYKSLETTHNGMEAKDIEMEDPTVGSDRTKLVTD